jgi:hypothetical protein
MMRGLRARCPRVHDGSHPLARIHSMKLIVYLLAIILIVVAGVYLWFPANSLPSFLPGYDPALTRVRLNHGIAAGIVGVVLLIVGRFVGRRG